MFSVVLSCRFREILFMARKSEFFKSPKLTFAQQRLRMSSVHPSFRGSHTRNVASWTGDLQPSAISDTYTVRIDYTFGKRPKVWVLQPQLRRRTPGQRIRHTFADGSICLHERGEWTAIMFIANTIVPWLALWLLHYEVWHATGEWHGGGHEPESGKNEQTPHLVD